MADHILDETVMEIQKEREKIWLEKPEDINLLRKKIGTKNQNFTIVMYANSDTQAMVKYLFNFLEASKQRKIDINTMKNITIQILKFDQRKMLVYYNLSRTSLIIEKAISAITKINGINEYKKIIKELLLFIGKINYWIDLEIPWKQL
ncbi:MAG: hypothetical protein JXJ04_09455, partial [Spirochaetales bacterium]|nr:hypothetical protein [Spirochaetales bacterium]